MNVNKQINYLHNLIPRNYLERMNNDKVHSMKIAKKFSRQYWDGERKFGYGGYKYIEGRNEKLAKNLIRKFRLNSKSKILDMGCGKGYLLFDIKKIIPQISIKGIDISKYAVKNSKKEISKYIKQHDIRKKTFFNNDEFDLVISINTLHNLKIFDLFKTLKEIRRISKKSYIIVESYTNEYELFNLQCWALTCQSFYSIDEWEWIFRNEKFSKNEYNFIFFE